MMRPIREERARRIMEHARLIQEAYEDHYRPENWS